MTYGNNNDNVYLKMTDCTGDLVSSLLLVGELLYKLFGEEDSCPTEEELPTLKEYIKNLWYNTYIIQHTMDFAQFKECMGEYYDEDDDYVKVNYLKHLDADYFDPCLELVNYSDISWSNGENIYIPMFDHGEILVR